MRRPIISRAKAQSRISNACKYSHKKIFTNLEDAKKRAKQIRKGIGPKVSAYKCKYCGNYHIGHNRPPHRRKPNTPPALPR